MTTLTSHWHLIKITLFVFVTNCAWAILAERIIKEHKFNFVWMYTAVELGGVAGTKFFSDIVFFWKKRFFSDKFCAEALSGCKRLIVRFFPSR